MRDGDLIRLDARGGRLEALVDEAEWTLARPRSSPTSRRNAQGLGRELFANFRAQVGQRRAGAAAVSFLPEPQTLTRAEADARF